MKTTVSVSGVSQLDAALGELIAATSSATGKAALRRALIEAGQPTAERAQQLVPVRTGKLRDSIVVSSKLANRIGGAEFAAALKGGLGKGAAVAALKAAVATHAGSAGQIVVYVGAGQLPHAHLIEFGTVKSPAHPYMRPAWEETKFGVLDGLTVKLGEQISKSIIRAQRRGGGKSRFDTRPSKG